MTEAIHGKMAAILKDMDAIGKNSKNEAQNFKYRGIDEVYNTINPVLAKHSVFMTAHILHKDRQERTNAKGTILAFTSLRMRYRFYTDDGSFVETEAEGEGMDSGDKSSNKAMAVAHKYALLQAFCIPTKDLDDPDAQSHEVKQGEVPPQGIAPPPAGDRKAGAKKWGGDALITVNAFKNAAEFSAWHRKHATAIATVRDFNEALHKRLTDAIAKKNSEFYHHPMAAE